MNKGVELVWPPRCNLDIVTGSVWRLFHETTTPMTTPCTMTAGPGVTQGDGRGNARPTSGWKGLFYGETDLNGCWKVRWIRSEDELRQAKAKPQRCKKCDAQIVPVNNCHPTDACPYYAKTREEKREEDDKLNRATNTNFRKRRVLASVRPQPGDGSCFFHSVGHHLRTSGPQVRRDVVKWMHDHLSTDVHGVPLWKWLAWEGSTAEEYLRNMSRRGVWGGATEMAALTHMHPELSFHVFMARNDGLFDQVAQIGSGHKEVWLRWSGGHYDALEPVQGGGGR